MSPKVMQALLQQGKLRPGDVLEINKDRLRNSEKVDNNEIEKRLNNADFWQCQITERTKEIEEVKYLLTDRYYKPTTLVNHITSKLTEEDYKPNEMGYWCHPRYNNTNLWDLHKS